MATDDSTEPDVQGDGVQPRTEEQLERTRRYQALQEERIRLQEQSLVTERRRQQEQEEREENRQRRLEASQERLERAQESSRKRSEEIQAAAELQAAAQEAENKRRKGVSEQNRKRTLGRRVALGIWVLTVVVIGAIAFGTGAAEPDRRIENLIVFTAIGTVLTYLVVALFALLGDSMESKFKRSLKITPVLVVIYLTAIFTPLLLIPFAVVSIAALVLTKKVFRKVY